MKTLHRDPETGNTPFRPVLRLLDPLKEGDLLKLLIEDLTPPEAEALKGYGLERSGEGFILSGRKDEVRRLVSTLPSKDLKERVESALSALEGRTRWKGGGLDLRLGGRTLVMGILNVTPDSFYDGGRFSSLERAVERALEMEEEGADIIDVGGESTRPGARPVALEDEIERTIPVVRALSKRLRVPISIDTRKAEVARLALDEGARIINDISGLGFDREMVRVAAAYRPLLIIMHIKGTPETMQKDTTYRDLFADIHRYFLERMRYALEEGVELESIAIDPGIGFGKSPEDNLRLIKGIGAFKVFGRPVVVGPSRKSFIGHVLGLPPEERLEGTAGAVAAAVLKGADIVRVHDVKEMKRVTAVVDAIGRVR